MREGIVQEYKRGLKAVAVEEVLDLVFYRPLAFLFVKLIYRTSITPNELTLASMALGICGGVSYAFGTPVSLFVGAIFYLLYNILDCSDGQLARLKHSGTPIGRILDGVADYAATVAGYVGLAIGYANSSANPALMWALTVFAGASTALQCGLLDFYRNRFLDVTLGRKSVLGEEQQAFRNELNVLRQRKGHWLEKALLWIYLRYSAVQRRFMGASTPFEAPAADPLAFRKENSVLMHCWTYIGPTTQWTVFITCSLLNMPYIILWVIAVPFNVMAAIMFLAQKRKDFMMMRRTGR